MLYAPSEDIPRKKRIPIFKSITCIPGAKGIIAKLIKTVATTIAGAIMKTGLSANGGIQSSLKKILTMSATLWRRPKGPTLFGPYLSCHNASILLSTQIKIAAIVSITIKTPATINMDCKVWFIIPLS